MSTKEIKYGLREGARHGREYPVAANQYFHNRGGHFVYMDTAGNVTLCASDTSKVLGWADTPKQASGYSSWKSSAGDSVFVITNNDAVYEIPYDNSGGNASVNATLVDKSIGLVSLGTTYDLIQTGRSGISASPLRVVDYDKDNVTVLVKLRTNY
jgi:hypothetical protein